MPKNKKPNTVPFSLRLTLEERCRLESLAGGMSLGTYVRMRLFGGNEDYQRTRGKHPVKDHKALAQLLGLLGRSRLVDNIDELARAAESGSLPEIGRAHV